MMIPWRPTASALAAMPAGNRTPWALCPASPPGAARQLSLTSVT